MTVFSIGSTGPDVTEIQNALNAKLKLHLATDGVYGSATAEEVRQFQHSIGIAVDGTVGPATWAKLFDQASSSPATHPAPDPSAAGVTSVTDELATAVASFEGGQSKDGLFHPYRDAVGVWTIGYGHTAGVSADSKPLTQAEAQTLLWQELNQDYLPQVTKLTLPLNQKQVDALTSFVYNLGPLYLEAGHTIGDALHNRDWSAAETAFLIYDTAGGQVLEGLKLRRQWESQLFGGGTYVVTEG